MHRVRVQENGIGSNGASDLGEDHGIPIDPLSVRQVEVIRGPATLRFGSQAIGGVVNADNNRIPTSVPIRGIATEINGAVSSVDKGLEGSVLLDAGKGNFAVHADAYGRTSSDYRVPHYPYLFDATQPFNGKQPNSSARSDGQALGGSYLFPGGFVGVAVSQFNSIYHIPGIDGAAHNTRIDMKQTKVTSKGEFRPQSDAVDAVRFWLGYTDYKHNEIGLADPADFTTDGVRQTFTNKELEGRTEVQFAPVKLGIRRAHHRGRRAVLAPEAHRAEPGRSGQHAQRTVRSDQHDERRGLHLQRVEIQQHAQGAARRPHRVEQSVRHGARFSVHASSTSPACRRAPRASAASRRKA